MKLISANFKSGTWLNRHCFLVLYHKYRRDHLVRKDVEFESLTSKRSSERERRKSRRSRRGLRTWGLCSSGATIRATIRAIRACYGITFRDTRLIFTYRQDRMEGEENASRECEWDAIAQRRDGQVTVEVNAVEGPFRKWLQITDFRAEQSRRTAFTSSRLLVTLFARCYTVSGDQWPFSNGHFRKILPGTMWYHGSRRHLHNRDIIPSILLAWTFFPTWSLELFLSRTTLL